MNAIHHRLPLLRSALPPLLGLVLAAGPAVAGSAVAGAAAAGSAGAQAASCPTDWGSLRETSQRASRARLDDVRAGRHACFDRLVLDLTRRPTGYSVRYVRTVRADGSGMRVPLRGRAQLEVVVQAPNHTDAGRLTYRPSPRRNLVDVAGFSTFRQVAWAGSFEGQSTLGLGVRARLPFRVLTLPAPGPGSRLVIDVAHHW